MATLHLVNKDSALEDCLMIAGVEDAVLLLEDGVYAAIHDQSRPPTVYALEVDVNARGLGSRIVGRTQVISDSEFVALVETHSPIVTWR